MVAQVVRKRVAVRNASVVGLHHPDVVGVVKEKVLAVMVVGLMLLMLLVMSLMLGRGRAAAARVGQAVHVGDPRVLAGVVMEAVDGGRGGEVAFLVQKATGAAEAGHHRQDQDGRRRAHNHSNQNCQAKMKFQCECDSTKPRMSWMSLNSLLNFRLDDLILFGAAVFVIFVAAAKDILTLV